MTNTKYEFQAETSRLLELLTHSIYSNKEIFLREIISNASDAIEKARVESLTNTNFLKEWEKFEIKVTSDQKNHIITIEDNWIWMTKQEVIKNLWTIAKSWTKDFIEKLKESKEQNSLIWQFWVWFYSAFMVWEKVEVITKSQNDTIGTLWRSNWTWTFEIEDNQKDLRWTIIKIYLKKEEIAFSDEWKLKELIKKYSNYVSFPILMLETENEENKWKRNFEQINDTKWIWNKDKSSLKDEDYNEFYSQISYDFNKPLSYIHTQLEWITSYKSVLFIPNEKNLFKNIEDHSIEFWPKLFVQNVMILENCKDLLPVYLRFISWVVETQDLPLNISREMLQSNPMLEKIKKWLTKKVLDKLKYELKENSENYDKFLKNFWKILKEWIYYDNENKELIAWILKFNSNLKSRQITLDEYLETAQISKNSNEEKEIKNIYYILAKNESEAKSNPFLSQFNKQNIDVIILSDNIDEWIIQTLSEYKWNKLISITSDEVELKNSKDEEEKLKEEQIWFKDLLELAKNTIWTDKVQEVKITNRLWENIWALSSPKWTLTPQMEKMMRQMWQEIPSQKRILELNPENNFVKNMLEEFKKDVKSQKLQDMINYSYDQAILLEWWEIKDIKWFISRIEKYFK